MFSATCRNCYEGLHSGVVVLGGHKRCAAWCQNSACIKELKDRDVTQVHVYNYEEDKE